MSKLKICILPLLVTLIISTSVGKQPRVYKVVERGEEGDFDYWNDRYIFQQQMKNVKIGVQGAPFNEGQPIVGTEEGPNFIRDTGFMDIVANKVKVDIKDFGDISYVKPEGADDMGKIKRLNSVMAMNKAIKESTLAMVADGRFALTLGGDHSISIGTMNALADTYPGLRVLWIDAHGDINTIKATDSGNIHGMPLAFVIKELRPYMKEIFDKYKWLNSSSVDAKNVAYIGLRDIDPAERAILNKFGIMTFTVKDVDRLGIVRAVHMAINELTRGRAMAPLHVTFDIDALDDLELESTGTVVPGGLTLREALTVVEELRDRTNMVGFDLTEVNPKLGSPESVRRTGLVSKHLLINLLGHDRNGVNGDKKPEF